MNLNRIKLTMATGMLAASMILPGMTAFANDGTTSEIPKTVTNTTGTDNKDVNGIITKTLLTPEGVSYSNETFKFTFAQDNVKADGTIDDTAGTNDSGVKANLVAAAIPELSISGISSTANSCQKAKGDNDSELDYYTNSVKGSIDLSNLTVPGVYTYTVTERADHTTSKGVVWSNDTATYKLRVYVSKDSNGNITKKMTIVDNTKVGKSNENSSKVESAEFVNKMTKRGGSGTDGDKGDNPNPSGDNASFVIGKTVDRSTNSNQYVDPDKDYTFTVDFTANSLDSATNGLNAQNIYSYLVYYSNGDPVTNSKNEQIGGTLNAENKTLTLKAGQEARFYNIYAGTRVTVTESYVTNLYSVSAVSKSNGNTTGITESFGGTEGALSSDSSIKADGEADASRTGAGILVGENGGSVTFTNTFSDVTVTGVVTNIAPYVTLVVAAVIAVAAYMGLKSRIAR